MKILEFLQKEFSGWGRYERIIFPFGILFIIVLSFIMNDSKVALISSICGVSYSILAGKGKYPAISSDLQELLVIVIFHLKMRCMEI